tara:strand:+ start:450 stop:806 length:357 start_codon:yes stop_codon:yes gene_type:complete
MTVNYIVKLVEGLGIPLAVALTGGVALWKLIAFVLKDLKTDVADKQDELQGSLKLQHTMIVRLIDRIRTLEINTMMANTALLTKSGCDIPEWRRPRSERIANLKEEIKDVSHNGEGDE